MKKEFDRSKVEQVQSTHHHLLCWKSVFAGVLIAMMSFLLLTALGAGIGGATASHLIANNESGSGLASGAGIWLGLSAVISLFMGSYFSLRISRFVTNKVGAAHGFVVASIFFLFMMFVAGSGVGAFARGLGDLAQGIGNSSGNAISSPIVQDVLNRSLASSGTLKSPPSEVAQGLAVRLMQNDVESARNYLAYQTGLSAEEVNAKIAQLKGEFDAALKTAGEKASEAVATAGWSLFVTFFVGLLGALIGGRVGAHANTDRPLAVPERRESEFVSSVVIPV